MDYSQSLVVIDPDGQARYSLGTGPGPGTAPYTRSFALQLSNTLKTVLPGT